MTRRAALAALWVVGMSACTPAVETVPSPLSVEEATAFAHALAGGDVTALAGWTRTQHPVAVRRECADCSPGSQWRHDSIWTADRWRVIAPSPVRVELADPEIRLSCEASCCHWTHGLLDHATVYLQTACFERDATGWYVIALEIVDG